MAKPPRSPTTLNTSRNRAIDIGTDSGMFPDDMNPMDHEAGVPTANAGGAYRDNVQGPGFTPAPSGAAPDPKSVK